VQFLQSSEQGLEALLQEFLPECRIAARARELSVGNRRECSHADQLVSNVD